MIELPHTPIRIRRKQYVVYVYADGSETPPFEVDFQDPLERARQAADFFVGFYYFEQLLAPVLVDGVEVILASPRLSCTGIYYIDADRLTATDCDARGLRTEAIYLRATAKQCLVRTRLGSIRDFIQGVDQLVFTRAVEGTR